MSSVNKDSFTSFSFPNWMTFFFFFGLIDLVKTSSIILNRNGSWKILKKNYFSLGIKVFLRMSLLPLIHFKIVYLRLSFKIVWLSLLKNVFASLKMKQCGSLYLVYQEVQVQIQNHNNLIQFLIHYIKVILYNWHFLFCLLFEASLFYFHFITIVNYITFC